MELAFGSGARLEIEPSMRLFEDVVVGESSELSRVISQSDVDKFVGLTGDDNPLHIDEEFARRTSFKKPVVHGMLAGSLVSTLIGTRLPGPGALWVRQEFKFLGPIRIGDSLVVRAVVTAKHSRDRTLELDVEARVEGRGLVLSGKGTVMMLSPENSDKEPNVKTPVKKALITGATGEIGMAITRSLAANGFHVIIHSNRNQKAASLLHRELTDDGMVCDFFQCDLSKLEDVKRFGQDLVGRFGTIDTLILNASAHVSESSLLTTKSVMISESLSLNLFSSLELIQQFAPGMMEQQWGRIIGVSSDAVHASPTKHWFAYTVGKTTLESLIRQASIEFGHRGITSNVVAPGMTDTSFISNISARSRQVIAQATPNRRLATTSDVANAVSFLCSAETGHVNGQTIRVNGGIGV